MEKKFLNAFMAICIVLAALGALYLILGIVIVLVSYIFGIEPVEGKFPLLFK